jgi:hypothetical protein
MKKCTDMNCDFYNEGQKYTYNCCAPFIVPSDCKNPLIVKKGAGANVPLDRGVSNDAIIDLMKRMEQGDGEVQWVSCGETVFEALWALVEESEGRERLARKFPHYC